MGRKKTGNVQFNCRVKPYLLKEMRKQAKLKKMRLGSIVEQAFELFIYESTGK
jgi:hypothetical protein